MFLILVPTVSCSGPRDGGGDWIIFGFGDWVVYDSGTRGGCVTSTQGKYDAKVLVLFIVNNL